MSRLCVTLILLIFSPFVSAWEDHAKLTNIVLQNWIKSDKSIAQNLNQPVKVETLAEFLQATKDTLPRELNEIENWARSNEHGYQPLPDRLFYQPLRIECSSDIAVCFKQSLRINLDVPFAPVIYDVLHHYSERHGFVKISAAKQLLPSYIPLTFNLKDFKVIPANAEVNVADVIATASMQPDFGFDTFLYENSGTTFGSLYGFGAQPIGNPGLPFQSQMLFHMSTYDEDAQILALVPRLQENYPEYRAFLYLNLSRFATETHHPYWAAVFLGWGLHYLQDMTQPYHSSLDYGLDVGTVVQALIEAGKNNYAPFLRLETMQTNRHVMLENLTRVVIASHVDNDKDEKILIGGLTDKKNDGDVTPFEFNSSYLRNEISNIRLRDFPDYAAMLQATVPAKYINSAELRADDVMDFNAIFTHEMTASQRLMFSQAIDHALEWYGAYTRACVLAIHPQFSG